MPKLIIGEIGMRETVNGLSAPLEEHLGCAETATEGSYFFLTDHLGSVVAVTDESGAIVSETRYLPFGEIRIDVGSITQTDFGYTNQKNLPGLGLMDYRTRFYYNGFLVGMPTLRG